jgi:hypothetical protein
MKSNHGAYRARICNARGFEQVDGEHCDQETKSSTVISNVPIRVTMMMIVMAAWTAHLMDVHDAFLKGKFKDAEITCMQAPQGFKKSYPKNLVLLLLRTMHRLVQEPLAFWRHLKRHLCGY